MIARAKSALKQIYLRAKSAAIVDRGGDPADAVFLAGGARSGTTWLSELINYDNAYRYMFEPFGVRQLGDFWYGSYLRPDDPDPATHDRAEFILSGRFHDPWVDQFNKRLAAERRLIKEVRANLWIKWLRTQFPQVPVVFVMRHPIPTVRSRFKRYFDAKDRSLIDTDPAKRTAEFRHYLLDQVKLVEDHLAPFKEVIANAESVWDQRLLVWCVQNFVPLRQFKLGEAHIAFYESFCLDPLGELRRLFAFLGREVDAAAAKRVWKPSPMARYDTMPDPATLVSGWTKKVPDADVARAVELLELFGLDDIYGADPLPKPDGLAAHAAAVERAAT